MAEKPASKPKAASPGQPQRKTTSAAPRRQPEPVILQVEPYGGSTRLHNPALPLVFWDDFAVTRGEGVFETLLIREGEAKNLDRHLARFAASAKLLGLPAPSSELWRRATAEAAAAWNERSEDDASCVWTLSRGRASTGHLTAWISVKPVSERQLEQREHGVKVMCAPRGYRVQPVADSGAPLGASQLPGGDLGDGAGQPGGAKQSAGSSDQGGATAQSQSQGQGITASAPWLILGAKTLSYAANMAAQRYAQEHGFDDVIWVESGRVLEGATSTVLAFFGKTVVTPPANGDILPGTTQAAVFERAERKGWRCEQRELTVEELEEAESVWLVSSVRIAARVTQLNNLAKPAPENEDKVRRLIVKAIAK